MSKLKKLISRLQAALDDKPLSDSEPLTAAMQEEAEDTIAPKASETSECLITKKEQVLRAIMERLRELNPEDIPHIEDEMLTAFEKHKNGDYFSNFDSADYYRFLDLREQPDTHVVVIGDIHCDFISLSAILLKLSVSPYDYYEHGIFVFMGDYLDRGDVMFETLLLLFDLQNILGERMIMLRGNHELIYYDENLQQLGSQVYPQDSVPCLNKYCIEDKAFLKAFGSFYSSLSTYIYLKAKDQNILLTHGGIPRNIFLDSFRYDEETGAIIFENDDSHDQLLRLRNDILHDMIWGDPCAAPEKYQTSGRFQFGSKQFEAYASKNNLSRIFRSHEPVKNGFASFFDNRLFTIFSTGGIQNKQSGYMGVQPAFAVINGDGTYTLENSNLYRVSVSDKIDVVIDLFTEEVESLHGIDKYALHKEFGCSADTAIHLHTMIVKIINNFAQQ